MPVENVKITHIQKDTRETLSSINNVGIIETKELASPWAYTPENVYCLKFSGSRIK
jgi:hypothetical protein